MCVCVCISICIMNNKNGQTIAARTNLSGSEGKGIACILLYVYHMWRHYSVCSDSRF
jgi:hypothetical protein